MVSKDISLLIKYLDDFFVHFLLLKKCDVFYIGRKDNIDLIFNSIPREYIGNIHATFLDNSKYSVKFNPFVNEGIARPFLVFDEQGLEFLKKNNISPNYLSAHYLTSDNGFNFFDYEIGHLPLLHERYNKLLASKDMHSAIVGSSYTLNGFPETLLRSSANLSISGGDLSLSYSFIKNILKKTKIRNFIVSMGYFDMFYELSLSLAHVNRSKFYVARYFCDTNDIEYEFSKTRNKTILEPIREYIDSIYASQNAFHSIDYVSKIINDRMDYAQHYSELMKERDVSVDFCYSSKQILERTISLSKNYERKGSFEYNKEMIKKLVELVKSENASLYFIVPPFLPLFNELYKKEIKHAALEYVRSFIDDNIHIVDLSEDDCFSPEDFHDADHLNFNGAKKVCAVLKGMGIPL